MRSTHTERLWDVGQQHLAAGRYLPAIHYLDAARRSAWLRRDARTLARVYLPLLEARRQVRYLAAEGTLWLGVPALRTSPGQLGPLLGAGAGTLILAVNSPRGLAHARRLAGIVRHGAMRRGRAFETLVLIERNEQARLASLGDATWSGGLDVQFTADSRQMPPESVTLAHGGTALPLPAMRWPVSLDKAAAAQVRESLLIGWEALALRWQHRHPLSRTATPWEELGWLEAGLRIDPACEPIAMRLIALAEQIERTSAAR